MFLAFFLYIWPLAGPNIAEKGGPLLGKALGRVWKGFGRIWEGFRKAANFGNAGFWRLKAPKTHISGRTDGVPMLLEIWMQSLREFA